MGDILKVNRSIYILQGKNGAVVEFTNVADTAYGTGGGAGSGGKRGEFVPRGKKDDVLSRMHKLMTESPNKLRLVKTRRDFVIGDGLRTRRTRLGPDGEILKQVNVRNLAVETFRKQHKLDKVITEAAFQQAFANDVFIKLTLGLNKKVEKLEVLDSFHVRARKLKAGETEITTWIFNPTFGTKSYKKDNSVEYPAFDPADPTGYPVSIIHLRDKMPGQFYYQLGDWWGTEAWAEVANKIPKFHSSGLENGYNIKYHITIPDNQFAREGQSEEDQEALKIATLDSLGSSLTGLDNVDKAIFTFNPVDQTGKMLEGIKITPLDNKMSDDAYTTLFTTANIAQASGHGVQPVLAGIDTGGKLGGSGKELEAAANYMQAFLTKTDRSVLLELMDCLQAIEGWESDLEFFFENVKIYTYDVTPAAASQNPNSAKKKEEPEDDEDEDATEGRRAA